MSQDETKQRPEAARAAGQLPLHGSDCADDGDALTEDSPRSGQKLRRWPGLLWMLVGIAFCLLCMGHDGRIPRGVLVGLLGMVLACLGLLQCLGVRRLDSTPLRDWRKGSLAALPGEPTFFAPIWTGPLAVGAPLLWGLVAGAQDLPWVIAACLLLLVPASLRRAGLGLLLIATALQLPLLGAPGLWDPWETHYGEVAREILARDDWITLWWAQDGWFMSKPVLIFWSEALVWNVLGVEYTADHLPHGAEWALRLPVFAMSLAAIMSVYLVVSRVFSRRAGLLAGVVLACCPYFFFLTRQAITDMPFVANMTVAVCMLALALRASSEAVTPTWTLPGGMRVCGQRLVLLAISLIALPQALYLVSRNFTFYAWTGFRPHLDAFSRGSAGNAGISGNTVARTMQPVHDTWLHQPATQGGMWLLGLLLLVWLLRRERRQRSLYMFGFYLACSLAFMGKGIPGFGLPGLVAALFLLTRGRLGLLWSGQLRIAAGLLTLAVTGLPWFVAMYVRLGSRFTDRLFIHDHINRLASGVHGDTGTIQYFVAQLGYGVFPWIGLAPAALAAWWTSGRNTLADDMNGKAQEDTRVLMGIWFAASFVLFSAMITKFHHYIFPCVPPLAVAIGVWLDRSLASQNDHQSATRRRLAVLCAGLAPAPLVAAAGGWLGDLRGVPSTDIPGAELPGWVAMHPSPVWLCMLLGIGGACLLGLSAWLARDARDAPESGRIPSSTLTDPGSATGTDSHDAISADAQTPPGFPEAMNSDAHTGANRTDGSERAAGSALTGGALLGGSLLCGAAVLAFAGRDLAWVTPQRPAGFERLVHLFVYNYGRPWPTGLDYQPILSGFAIISVALLVLAAWSRLRVVALQSFVSLGLLFALWGLNVYMLDLTPHWGQRELVARYYAERQGPEDPLVAWQMNWKGENFYSGNHVHTFVKLDNKAIKKWLGKQPGKDGFFLLEHTRLKNFRRVMGARKLELLTSIRDNNKFLLLKARL